MFFALLMSNKLFLPKKYVRIFTQFFQEHFISIKKKEHLEDIQIVIFTSTAINTLIVLVVFKAKTFQLLSFS